MGKLNGLELKRARLVPSAMFASPDAVLEFDGLSRAQKISDPPALGVRRPAHA